MKLYSSNSPVYRLEFVALIYFTLVLVATVNLMLTGDKSFFWKAHLIFICGFSIILFSSNALSILVSEFIGNFGGICLFWFLVYYLIMTLGYPHSEISSDHLRYITRDVVPGFLLGFVFLGKIDILKVREFPRPSQSVRSILLNSPLIAALLFYLSAFCFILVRLWSIRRTDIFLIKNLTGIDQSYYQYFGRYALLAFIGALTILHYYLKEKKDYYISFCFLVICLGSIVSVLLALVGSNKELVTLSLILAMCIIYAKPKNWLIRFPRICLRNLFVVVSVLVLCGVAWYYSLSIELPYLRIFGYQKQTSMLENRGLKSRIGIVMGTGIEQMAVNPVFGNLGAEHIVGTPGGYMHSLVSVQSHLGLIGTFLLSGYLAHRLYRLYRNNGRRILRTITPPILLISLIGTFFTWFVFWFLIGALFAPRKDL